MNLEIERLSAPAQKVLSEGAPLPMKMLGAKGVIPGAPPPDALTVVVSLSQSSDEKIRDSALGTLKSPPRPLLDGALNAQLQLAVLMALAQYHAEDRDVVAKMLKQEAMTEELLCELAQRANELSGEVIATNEALVLRFSGAIEQLYMNKRVRMSTSDRLIELAVRNKLELEFPAFKLAAQAIMNQLVPEPTEERTFDDTLFIDTDAEAEAIALDPDEDVCETDDEGHEVVKAKNVPLFKQIAENSVTANIRLAMLGNSAARLLLVRSANRLVAEAAVKSPRMTENEAVSISASRAVSEQVLRLLANNRELTRSYQVKLNLVTNPLTPLTFSSRFLAHLRDGDIRQLAKSKNVPGAIQKLARNQMLRKK